MRAITLPCPRGFDFRATALVLRRGADDPLVWFDGQRWRRRLALNGTAFLLEVTSGRSDAAGGSNIGGNGNRITAAAAAAPEPRLRARLLAGRASDRALEGVVARLFGLDDPGRALTARIPRSARRVLNGTSATATLPGYPHLFEALVHTILGQQISAAAANVHRAAFTRKFGKPFRFRGDTYWTFPEAGAVAPARLASLRRLGLSRAKAVAVGELARAFDAGRLSESALAGMPAEAAIDALTELPGIGRWTAEWVLLRGLRRFDIVPAGDLAIRKAVTWFTGRRSLLPETAVREVTNSWAPYGGLIAFRLLLAHRRAIG